MPCICADEGIRLNSERTDAWHTKGTALFSLGSYKESIRCFDKIIMLNSEYIPAWYYKGDALKELGNDKLAEECFAYAKELEEKE